MDCHNYITDVSHMIHAIPYDWMRRTEKYVHEISTPQARFLPAINPHCNQFSPMVWCTICTVYLSRVDVEIGEKHVKKILIAILFVVALAGTFACGADTSGNTGTAVTATSAPAGSTPTAAAKTFNPGDTVKLGSWTIIVNKVSTSAGGEFAKPKSGNIFLVVNVTVTNGASSAQPISSIGNFKLADSTGQTYTETIVDGLKNPPDGTVAAGGKISGDLAYEVPKSMHDFDLQFEPDITSTDMVTITIKI